MNKIERFNHELNSSIPASQTSLAKPFREQIDVTLRSIMRTQSNKTKAGIIGAGKCQDFSLPIFLEECSLVVLTDVDIPTVRDIVGQKNNAQYRRVEYTGFEEHGFFDDFKERLINARDYAKIDQILEHKLRPIETYQFLPQEMASYDLLYVSPIYSQLVYQQVLYECSLLRENGYPEHFIKHIEGYMLDQMIPVINRFNTNLVQLLNDQGTLIVASDIFELDRGSAFYQRVANGISNRDVMEEIYKGYASKYGMGLGDYGLYHLDELMNPVRSKWLLWPFSEKKSYAVKLKVYKKFATKGGKQ